AKQCCAEPNDEREAVDHFQQQGTARHHQRNTDAQAKNQQYGFTHGYSSHRNHVIQAHHEVRNQNRKESSHKASLDIDSVLVIAFRQQQDDANIQQQNLADQFQQWQLKQLCSNQTQNDTHHNRSSRADYDRFLLLVRWQRTCCQGNHNRIITGQQNVDPNDL